MKNISLLAKMNTVLNTLPSSSLYCSRYMLHTHTICIDVCVDTERSNFGQSVYILYTVYILDSGCCFPLGPLEGDISSWTLTTARTSMNVKIELYYNRRCSRDIIQFISWTPEHKESRTKSRTITSKNDTSTAFWLSCMVSYHAERSNWLG